MRQLDEYKTFCQEEKKLMKHKHWFFVSCVLMVATLALTACAGLGRKPGAEMQGGTVVMGFYQEPELLNPFIRTQTIAGVAGDFLERGLTIVLPSGERVPDLVTEVPSVDNGGVSADGLTITYKLKEDIVWSDGDAFDCDDVVFTFEAIMHPESGAVSTSGYDKMESVTCSDPHTVVVQYAEFYAPYLTRFPSTATSMSSML